jgi:hypothetical protein
VVGLTRTTFAPPSRRCYNDVTEARGSTAALNPRTPATTQTSPPPLVGDACVHASCIDLDLGAGLVAELLDLTARYPLRERLWGHLMTALYRSGRQADALATYQRLYQVLGDELGIEPGLAIQGLHRRILTARADSDDQSRPTVAVPRQLPADVAAFTGRAAN